MPTLWLNNSDTADPSGPYTDLAVQQASWILYKLTAEKYPGIGTSTDVFTSENYVDMSLTPTVINGQVTNIPRFVSGLRNLRLRQSPVLSVQSVVWHGEVMDPSTYTLRNSAYLVRANAIPWVFDPVNEMVITYTHGVAVPMAGKRAAIRLANEMIYALNDDPACTLPERISSITRQGETFTVLDPQTFLLNGKTGIYEIDLFLAAANPDKAKKKPKVFSPDKPRGERIN